MALYVRRQARKLELVWHLIVQTPDKPLKPSNSATSRCPVCRRALYMSGRWLRCRLFNISQSCPAPLRQSVQAWINHINNMLWICDTTLVVKKENTFNCQ